METTHTSRLASKSCRGTRRKRKERNYAVAISRLERQIIGIQHSISDYFDKIDVNNELHLTSHQASLGSNLLSEFSVESRQWSTGEFLELTGQLMCDGCQTCQQSACRLTSGGSCHACEQMDWPCLFTRQFTITAPKRMMPKDSSMITV